MFKALAVEVIVHTVFHALAHAKREKGEMINLSGSFGLCLERIQLAPQGGSPLGRRRKLFPGFPSFQGSLCSLLLCLVPVQTKILNSSMRKLLLLRLHKLSLEMHKVQDRS